MEVSPDGGLSGSQRTVTVLKVADEEGGVVVPPRQDQPHSPRWDSMCPGWSSRRWRGPGPLSNHEGLGLHREMRIVFRPP